jgi:hypothetical protein
MKTNDPILSLVDAAKKKKQIAGLNRVNMGAERLR